MIEASKNKDMASVATKENKSTKEGYFFANPIPMTIMAENLAEATEIYKETIIKNNK